MRDDPDQNRASRAAVAKERERLDQERLEAVGKMKKTTSPTGIPAKKQKNPG